MNPKEMIRDIGNPNLNLQERLFRLIMLIGMIGLAIGILVGIASGEGIGNTIALVIALAVFAAITYLSIRYNRTQVGAVVILPSPQL